MSLDLGSNSSNGWTEHGDIAAINGATALTVAFWVACGAAVNAGPINKGKMVFFLMDASRSYWIRETTNYNADSPHIGTAVWQLITSAVDVVPPDILSWNHFALVYDGSLDVSSRMTLYKNTVSLPLVGTGSPQLPQGSDAATTAPTSLIDTSPQTLQYGHSNTSSLVGHFRVWSVALTQGEVAQEMNRYWANRQTSLLMDCPFDDQLAARDYSGNGNHGVWDPVNGTPGQRQGPPIPYGGKVLVLG